MLMFLIVLMSCDPLRPNQCASLLQDWTNKFFKQLNFSGSLISNFCYYGILTILLQ